MLGKELPYILLALAATSYSTMAFLAPLSPLSRITSSPGGATLGGSSSVQRCSLTHPSSKQKVRAAEMAGQFGTPNPAKHASTASTRACVVVAARRGGQEEEGVEEKSGGIEPK